MIEAVCGAAGFLIALAAFFAGFFFAKNLLRRTAHKPETPSCVAGAAEPPEEEIAAQRQALEAEQAAFQTLLGYNVDTVYGNVRLKDKE